MDQTGATDYLEYGESFLANLAMLIVFNASPFRTAVNIAVLILRLFYDLELLRFRHVTLLWKLQLTVSELKPPFHLLPDMLTIPDHFLLSLPS